MRSNVIQWYFDMLHWRNMNVCCWYIRLYLKKRKQKYLRVNETVNSMRSRFEPGNNLQACRSGCMYEDRIVEYHVDPISGQDLLTFVDTDKPSKKR